jgi:hypothetical protein
LPGVLLDAATQLRRHRDSLEQLPLEVGLHRVAVRRELALGDDTRTRPRDRAPKNRPSAGCSEGTMPASRSSASISRTRVSTTGAGDYVPAAVDGSQRQPARAQHRGSDACAPRPSTPRRARA